MNKTVWILQRDTLTPVSRFGDGGRYPGRFYGVGSVAVDSKGNVYTGEEQRRQARPEVGQQRHGPGAAELRSVQNGIQNYRQASIGGTV